jgi:ABC-type glycerol-3-phosphate transport system substrate-binding protein
MKITLLRTFSIMLILSILITGCAQATPKPEENVKLTFWFWAEPDAPGANDWIAKVVEEYKAVKPNVTVEVVPQGTDQRLPDSSLGRQRRTGYRLPVGNRPGNGLRLARRPGSGE